MKGWVEGEEAAQLTEAVKDLLASDYSLGEIAEELDITVELAFILKEQAELDAEFDEDIEAEVTNEEDDDDTTV